MDVAGLALSVTEAASTDIGAETPSRSVLKVDVCVCTYNRPEVVHTLRSIAAQQGLGAAKLRVIVADNAAQPTARELIAESARDLGLHLIYIHAPANNISVARNACLNVATADWIAFLDDDEVAAPQWLKQILSAARTDRWDAVLGPVKALYSPSAPVWLRAGDFHSQRPVYVRGRIETGYTGNVLLRRSFIEREALRFRTEFGRSGGEDADFMYRMSDAGGRIGFEPTALAYEPVPAQRASLRWLLRRNFRAGQTHGSRLIECVQGVLPRSGAVLLAAAKALFCISTSAFYAVDPVRRHRFLMRAALHCGVVARLGGLRELNCY
jgi:succinoglycan biosynthesis protein ExoM